MLIKDILQYLLDAGVRNFVADADLFELCADIDEKRASAVSVCDVRSAAFYACGLSQKNDSPVAVILRREYLSNTFTALMESWFQKRCIVVIAVGSDVLNYSLECYKTCTDGRYKIQELSQFKKCFDASARNMPSIFLVDEEIPYANLSYSIDINAVSRALPEDCRLFVYSPITSGKIEKENVFYTDSEYKYGTISKFLGHCITGKEKSILLTNISVLKLEMNIFNSRYIDRRFNLIVTGEKPSENIIQWLQSNEIDTVFCDSAENSMEQIIKSDRPTAVFIVTEEDESVCTPTL